jgi:hypothetical protein
MRGRSADAGRGRQPEREELRFDLPADPGREERPSAVTSCKRLEPGPRGIQPRSVLSEAAVERYTR